METYKLHSKLVEKNNEYIIQTSNDVTSGFVSTDIFINGALTESVQFPHPEDIKAEDVLSLVQTTHGDRKKELETMLHAYQQTLKEGTPDMIFHLGQAFFYKKFYREAHELLVAALKGQDEFHEARHYLSQTLFYLGKIDDAIAAAEKAVALRPKYADYRNNLGELYLAGRQYRKATLEFERAIGINMYYSDAYFNYGLALLVNALERTVTELFQNFLSKSKDYFYKASLINPEYRSTDYETGIKALEQKEIHTAFTYMSKVRDDIREWQRQKAGPYYMRYIMHSKWINEKALLERIRFLQKELERNPSYVDLFVELSRCYIMHAKLLWKKGIDQYRKTLELNPSATYLEQAIDETEKTYARIESTVTNIMKQG